MRSNYQAHNATEWQQIMDDYRHSSLNQKAFCEQKGLAMSTFSKWRKQLGLVNTHSAASTTADFKPLLSVSTVPVASATVENNQHGDWDVELVLGAGMVLRIRTMG